MKLTTHLRLVPRSRIRGAIPPLPNTPSWPGAQLKAQGLNLPLPYIYAIIRIMKMAGTSVKNAR